MVSRNEETSEGDGVMTSAAPVAPDQLQTRASNSVFKSGYLFISSKGIGWTSWKKRWFILTRTSLVFFRSDPNTLPPKGSEVNLTLGGIDLNSSGSVVVRADKKLLTVLFPDGRDGRAFTLKAETSEDLYEWKTALENALAQAPSATFVMTQSRIFRNDVVEATEESFGECILEQWRDKKPVNSVVAGRPALLALEEIDGTPSFLEKALRFIEEYGIRVEGILRQSADGEEVERRVQEHEQGKDEFSLDEDPHVVVDCVKHVLRELPSYPVPASCCSSLLEAFRSERASRIHAMRSVITESFPEPNRRLLQRILKMMRTVVSHKAENRMSTSAVAACMAPLLLRPLLAGDCQFDDDFHLSGDGSLQLLQAAAAANHAQAIIIILLEEYQNIFSNEPLSPELYSDSEGCYTEEEEFTDDELREDDGYEDAENDIDTETENDHEQSISENFSERSGNEGSDCYSRKDLGGQDATSSHETEKRALSKGEVGSWPLPIKAFEIVDLGIESPKVGEVLDGNNESSPELHNPLPGNDFEQNETNLKIQTDDCSSISMVECHYSCENFSDSVLPVELHESPKSVPISEHLNTKSAKLGKSSSNRTSLKKSNNALIARRPAIWGRTSARKNLSMESIDLSGEDGVAIQKLDISKTDLQKKIVREADENAVLQTSLESRKRALRDRRLALEQEVLRLQEQLERERELRAALEAGLGMPARECSFVSFGIDSKTREELEEVAQAEADVIKLKAKVSNLHEQLNQQVQSSRHCESCGQNYSNSSSRSTQDIDLKYIKISTRKEDALPPAERNAVMKQGQTASRNMTSAQKQQTTFSTGNSSRMSEAKLLPPKNHTNRFITHGPKFADSTTGSTYKAVSQKHQTSGARMNGLKSADTENVGMKDKDQPSLRSKMQQSNSSSENSSPKSAAQLTGSSGEETSDAVFDTSTKMPVDANAGLFMETVTDTSAPSKKHKGASTSNANEETLTTASATASKKLTGRTEGQTASSALTRLTNRFNFRRERRTSSTELPSTDPPGNTPTSEATAPTRTNSR